MNISRCRMCGSKIPEYKRADSLFCSELCRQQHYDISRRPNHNKRASNKGAKLHLS